MIIVSGKIYVTAGNRDTFLERSLESVKTARRTKGCRAFVVGPDVIEVDRINIYEEWDSKEELMSFRGSGPDADIGDLIVDASVNEHHIDEDSA